MAATPRRPGTAAGGRRRAPPASVGDRFARCRLTAPFGTPATPECRNPTFEGRKGGQGRTAHDDRDAQVHPGAAEVCNQRDDNCDG
ncbi:MAG: putative metal-binding motif-containing protein, partial [Myxococcus sp.]|nr:putative metal-binding motif-containing protein [Myxococcus sp.]